MRSRERPRIFVAPSVGPHHKYPYRFRVRPPVLDTFELVVVPSQDRIVFAVVCCCLAKVEIANLSSRAGMAADGDDEGLVLSCRSIGSLCLESFVVAQSPVLKDVILSRNDERGNLDIAIVILDRPTLPVIIE
jgi:hypothetical protein